jgi:hypothetical protein
MNGEYLHVLPLRLGPHTMLQAVMRETYYVLLPSLPYLLRHPLVRISLATCRNALPVLLCLFQVCFDTICMSYAYIMLNVDLFGCLTVFL